MLTLILVVQTYEFLATPKIYPFLKAVQDNLVLFTLSSRTPPKTRLLCTTIERKYLFQLFLQHLTNRRIDDVCLAYSTDTLASRYIK